MQVFQAQNQLSHNYSRLFLPESSARFQQAIELEAVCVIMNHVDLALSLNCLLLHDTVTAFQHVVDLNLLECPQQIILTASVSLVDLAGIDLFLGIDVRSDD